MKPQEQKTEFIRLRAEGRSYSYIADTLHISKSTCSSWERELQDAIAELKQEQLNELYNSYAMTKEARVKKLGETLNGINEALDAVDLKEIPAEKLLDFKLKYILIAILLTLGAFYHALVLKGDRGGLAIHGMPEIGFIFQNLGYG